MALQLARAGKVGDAAMLGHLLVPHRRITRLPAEAHVESGRVDMLCQELVQRPAFRLGHADERLCVVGIDEQALFPSDRIDHYRRMDVLAWLEKRQAVVIVEDLHAV